MEAIVIDVKGCQESGRININCVSPNSLDLAFGRHRYPC